jgi:hypothetical protein
MELPTLLKRKTHLGTYSPKMAPERNPKIILKCCVCGEKLAQEIQPLPIVSKKAS